MTMPIAATVEAGQKGMASGAQLMPLAQQLATEISSGTVAMPNSAEGWSMLVDQFSTNAQDLNLNGVTNLQKNPPSTPAAPPTNQQSPATNQQGMQQSGLGQASPSQSAFMQQMAPWAKYASEQTGLDPSLILAQWGNETGWGTSYQWTHNFNPAGIGITSDAVQGQGYGSVQGGVQAYIDFLNQNPRYQAVKSAQGAQAQAVALGESGWAYGQYNSGAGPGSSLLTTLGQTQGAVGGAPPAIQTVTGATTANMGSSSAVNFAKTQIGVPYQWGGESPGKDFDCSGLVQAAFKSAGVDLPRTAQAQYDATTKIPVGQQLQAGDLVFFGGSTQSISHVGIYIGNGQMIDAPHTGAQVRIESYQWGDYIGATRPTDPAGVSTLPTSGPVTQGGVVGNYNQVLSKVLSAMNGGSRG